MATYFEDLTKVFDALLIQFGLDNSIEVQLENIKAPTDTSKPYLYGTQFISSTEQADLSVNEVRVGFYQVDVNFASFKGSANLNRMADLLNAAFKTGQELIKNDICLTIESVDITNIDIANGWATRSMTINWQVNTPRI